MTPLVTPGSVSALQELRASLIETLADETREASLHVNLANEAGIKAAKIREQIEAIDTFLAIPAQRRRAA